MKLYRDNGFRPLIPKKKKDLVRLKPKAVAYYEERAKALLKSWPGLEKQPIGRITVEQLNVWSQAFLADRSATGHNHTLGMLRNIFDMAVERGAVYHNPVRRIMRATEKPKKMILPTREQFEAFVAEVERDESGKAATARTWFASSLTAVFVWARRSTSPGRIVISRKSRFASLAIPTPGPKARMSGFASCR